MKRSLSFLPLSLRSLVPFLATCAHFYLFVTLLAAVPLVAQTATPDGSATSPTRNLAPASNQVNNPGSSVKSNKNSGAAAGSTKRKSTKPSSAHSEENSSPHEENSSQEKKSGPGWQWVQTPSPVYGDEVDAYVYKIAATAGPRQFVQWADLCAASLRANRPCSYLQQQMIGNVMGTVIGGSLSMLSDDPLSSFVRFAQEGQRVTQAAGAANAYLMENTPLSTGVLSFETKHGAQLKKLLGLLTTCVNDGQELTDCLSQSQIAAELQTIAQYNSSACARLTAMPANGGAVLSPGYCQVTGPSQSPTTPSTQR